MRTVLLGGWCDIVETFEGLLMEWGHGKVDFTVVVLPVKVNFDAFFSGVVD